MSGGDGGDVRRGEEWGGGGFGGIILPSFVRSPSAKHSFVNQSNHYYYCCYYTHVYIIISACVRAYVYMCAYVRIMLVSCTRVPIRSRTRTRPLSRTSPYASFSDCRRALCAGAALFLYCRSHLSKSRERFLLGGSSRPPPTRLRLPAKVVPPPPAMGRSSTSTSSIAHSHSDRTGNEFRKRNRIRSPHTV